MSLITRLLTFFVISVAVCSQLHAASLSRDEQNVVLLAGKHDDLPGLVARCTGFVTISNNLRRLNTAAHCIHSPIFILEQVTADPIQEANKVRLHWEFKSQVDPNRFIRTSLNDDIAQMQLNDIELQHTRSFEIAKILPYDGEKLTIVGFPGALPNIYADCTYLGVSLPLGLKDSRVIGHKVFCPSAVSQIVNGMSGGLVLNERGLALGVLIVSTDKLNEGLGALFATAGESSGNMFFQDLVNDYGPNKVFEFKTGVAPDSNKRFVLTVETDSKGLISSVRAKSATKSVQVMFHGGVPDPGINPFGVTRENFNYLFGHE